MENYLTKKEVKLILDNAPQGLDRGRIVDSMVARGYTLEGFNDTQPEPEAPKKDGLVKSIAKDVVGTLVTKPAARATEAITRTVAPNSLATKGYEAMANEGQSQNFNGVNVEQQKGLGQGGGRQVVGDTLKVGAYLFPYGKAAGAASKVVGKTAGGVASGATGGYLADVGFKLGDEDKSIGKALTPGLGTVIGAAIPGAGAGVKAIRNTKPTTAVVEDTIGRILQGQTKDIPLAQKALLNIETKGVKTREELSKKLSDGIKKNSEIVDQELAKDTGIYKLEDLAIKKLDNAGKEISTDYVGEALKNLDELYTSIGDDVSKSNIELLAEKAVTQGLTRKEVNDIARAYSEEFSGKAFSKTGDALTSVNAQKFENVRSGVKESARAGIGGKEAQEADRITSAMYNTKKLIDKGVEGVNKLQQRVQDRNILEKLSRGAVNMVNTLSGGALKAGVSAIIPSNVGLKTLNWLDLEKKLADDLKLIEKANGSKTDGALIKLLNKAAENFKFPGDTAVDDIGRRVDQFKKIPNKQGGFLDVGLKGKGTIPENTTISETKKYKSVDFNPSNSYLKRNIKVLNNNGIKVKSPDEVITLYHGTNAKGLKGITESGTLNPGSFLATDINASKGFVFGKGGDVIKIQVPVKDLGFVQDGGMAGSKGVSIQTIDKLVKGKDGIWKKANK